MLESFRLIALVANLLNPGHAPDSYVLDSGLTAEDCADGIAAGVQSVVMPDGSTLALPPASVLLCESEERQPARDEFINNGDGTFHASWESTSISIWSEGESAPVKRKATRKAKRKAK